MENDNSKKDIKEADFKLGKEKIIKKPGIKYGFLVLVLLFIVGFIFIGPFAFQFLPLFIGIFFAIYAYYKKEERKRFMQNFALKNNLEYKEKGIMGFVDARLFELGGGKRITNVVSGKYSNHPMRIFYYTYSIQQGKHTKSFYFTIFEITFEKTHFPYILLQSKTMWRYGKTDNWGDVKDMEFSIEDEFKDAFRLYATEGYEVEVFQIFTTSVLRDLKEKAQNYSIEFSGNKIYIYDDLFIDKEKDLRELYNVSKEIFDSLGPLLNRLHDDFDALHPYYSED